MSVQHGTSVDEVEAFIEELRAALWRKPELRIGQLIINAVGIQCPQLFYASNEKLTEEVRSF